MKKKISINLTGISLFSGAGGMDVGFNRAGIKVVWANEIDRDAGDTYEENNPGVLRRGDIRDYYTELRSVSKVGLVFGGPPCQGFSVAGKMDPKDERSTLLWSFLDVVDIVQPLGFVCENVKALGKLKKWRGICQRFISRAEQMDYGCSFVVLNSSDFGVPQNRERVFFVGIKGRPVNRESLLARLEGLKKPRKTVRETIAWLGPAGSPRNNRVCNARITMASNPVLRKSAYAGMLFNGLGRPINLYGLSATLPASMGGNKTPIIDEDLLQGKASDNWIENYHAHLMSGGDPLPFNSAPARLRRLTVDEAALIQTFPEKYVFCGSKSSVYQQIGNAVPCALAEAIAKVAIDEISRRPIPVIGNFLEIQGMLFENA